MLTTVSGCAEEMQNPFNRDGEGGHEPREDVDSLTGIYYSKLNILVCIRR